MNKQNTYFNNQIKKIFELKQLIKTTNQIELEVLKQLYLKEFYLVYDYVDKTKQLVNKKELNHKLYTNGKSY